MSQLPLLLLTLAACQGGTASTGEKPASPRPSIDVRDGKGVVLARLSEGRPCRATIEDDELIVGGRPLVMMLGETRWAGDDVDGSTVITRDNQSYARIFPADGSGSEVSIFDGQGVALLRANVTGDAATVRDIGQSPVRELRRTADGIAISSTSGDAIATVRGTQDLLLAAIVTATELSPELRALAACHRLLPSQKAAI